jgi:2-C-methyl-D-erythritol 2,4-cyclodiphosphate synthase
LRIGHGYDAHRLKEGRRLVIGGVEISYEKGLDGHSDADVLIHAVIDALLGAAGMGDIGGMFPDSSPAFKDADSMKLLEEVFLKLRENGFSVGNIDATVIAQAPVLKPYIAQMRLNIARACDTLVENVNIKATTEEKMGFTGRREGISAHAVCLIL